MNSTYLLILIQFSLIKIMTTKKYAFEEYEITLSKTSDSISIQLLDTTLYKLYTGLYNDIKVIDYCQNIDIFYTILDTSFNALVNSDFENATVHIRKNSANITLHINHTFYVIFEFDLVLQLDTTVNMSAKEMCIKKLEGDLIKATKKLNILQKVIDDYMEVTISNLIDIPIHQNIANYTFARNVPISIKINTKDIIIKSYGVHAVINPILYPNGIII